MERSTLHTVACLYAGVGFVDGELHQKEKEIAMARLQEFSDDADSDTSEVFADAVSFWKNLPASLTRYQQLVEIAKGLATSLDENTRKSILVDLEAIVRADGRLGRVEWGIVTELAKHLDLNPNDLTL